MKTFTTTLCLTIAVLLGSIGVSASADFQKGLTEYQSSDYLTALQVFRPLAEEGHANAQFYLGNIYRIGLNVRTDYKTALKWYRLAAEQGYAAAQIELGAMYYAGDGVKKDNIYAHMWWNILASSGDKEAVTRKNSIEKEMTFDQYEKAHNVAQECIRKKYKGC